MRIFDTSVGANNDLSMALEGICLGPIKNSEVYIIHGPESHNGQPHAAPPSPPTPCDTRSISPITDKLVPLSSPEVPSPPIEKLQITSPAFNRRLSTAVHVLSTEATALSCLTRLYETDPLAREGFSKSVELIKRSTDQRGKIVICGVGKSGHIAKKMVATMNSLRIPATYLHPTEALHGDLGKVSEFDVILLITFSGKTPELLQLVPHFHPTIPILVLTAHIHPSTCPIVDLRPDAVLLPSPIHESETDSFGFSAPTTSTTIALALGDALAVAISEEIHPGTVSDVFSRNHPGGAIGAAVKKQSQKKVSELAVKLSDIPFAADIPAPGTPSEAMRAMHVLISGYQSSSGWVRYSDGSVVPPRRIKRLKAQDMDMEATKVRGLVVERRDWFPVQEDTKVHEVVEILRGRIAEAECDDDVVVVTTRGGMLVGVIEVATLLSA